MSYLGNPALVLAAQDSIPVANYQYPQDPTVSINPKKMPCSWLNTVSGSIFICTDNTTDANVWVQSAAPVFNGALIHGASTTVSIPNTTWIILDGNTNVLYDTNSFYSAVNPSRLTIPSGVSVVRFSFGLYWSSFSSNGLIQNRLYKNGSYGFISGAAQTSSVLSGDVAQYSVQFPPIYVSEGDYFEVGAYQSSGASQTYDYNFYYSSFGVEVIQ